MGFPCSSASVFSKAAHWYFILGNNEGESMFTGANRSEPDMRQLLLYRVIVPLLPILSR